LDIGRELTWVVIKKIWTIPSTLAEIVLVLRDGYYPIKFLIRKIIEMRVVKRNYEIVFWVISMDYNYRLPSREIH
jgi:hypothetical protein